MAKGATSAGAAAALLLLLLLVAAAAGRRVPTPTPTLPPDALTSVWDAYPGAMINMCPHIPRRPIDFSQLNGRWFILEKGGLASMENLCEMDFQVDQGQNLTLHISVRAFLNRNLQNQRNFTWVMSEDNVWRDYVDTQMYMFVGYSTGRSLLLMCAVDDVNRPEDGFSYALSRERSVRPKVLAAARLPGNADATDHSQCPQE